MTLVPVVFQRKVVLDRLCMSIALLAVYTCNTCWDTSINDIIKLGSTSPEQCYVSLLLLKHITAMHGTHCHDNKSKHVLGRYIRENLANVQGYLAQVLQQSSLPQECHHQALSASNYWCRFSD